MQEVCNQLFCLLIFILTGLVIGILFDIFRILRRSFKTTDFITYLEDIIFWILTGCIMLFSIFIFNNGEIRSYVFIGIAIGIILYMLVISRFFIRISVNIIKFIKRILSYPIKLIKNVVTKIILKPTLKILKNIHDLTKNKPKHINKHKKMDKKEGILEKM